MSIFQEYDSDFLRNYDILFRQFEIDVSRLHNQMILESSLYDMEEQLFCEAETLDISTTPSKSKNNNKFMTAISQIGKAVSNFIKDVIDMIANIFNTSSHVDLQSYLDSATGSIELDYDLDRVNKQVRDKIREGRKLIKAISSKTGVDESLINDYVDAASKGIQKYGTTIIKTAGTYAQIQRVTGELTGLKQEMEDALTDCMQASNDPLKREQIANVYKAMQHWSNKSTQICARFTSDIQKEALRQQKEAEKKQKKGGR